MTLDITQNLVEGIKGLDPHIGGTELHARCYNKLVQRWLEWSEGYNVPIEKTTLRDAKVQSAIAGKDLADPVKEFDAILDYFMKPHGKTGELVFKPGQLKLALVIDHKILEEITNQREGICGSDDDDIFIRRKVCTQNVVLTSMQLTTSNSLSLRSLAARASLKSPVQSIERRRHPMPTISGSSLSDLSTRALSGQSPDLFRQVANHIHYDVYLYMA